MKLSNKQKQYKGKQMNKASLNKVILIGRLGKDPEQRQLQGGTVIAKFSIATTGSRKVGEQYQDETEWHNCVSFGKQAEYISNYFRKGQMVCVEGRLKTSNWEKDGVKHYKTEIMVETATALERSDVTGERSKPSATYQQEPTIPSASNPTRSAVNTKPVSDEQLEEELPF